MLHASFPPDFRWGAATSAFQIEGATHEDGRGPSIWDYFSSQAGATFRGHTGDIAIDHYHRMESDIALIASMGLNAYRFSVAWPRIIPDGTGPVNMIGLDFYDRMVDTLLQHNIEPMLTLYHWDLPLALHQRGGWLNRDTAFAFAEYAEIVARRLGDRVPYWTTLNEPWCSAFLGYGNGLHAPGAKDGSAAVTAGHHLLLAHGLAVPRIRAATPATAKVGIVLNLVPIYPADTSSDTAAAFPLADDFKNRWLLEPLYKGVYPDTYFERMQVTPPPIEAGDMQIIQQPLDFLGVNYYFRSVIAGTPQGFEELTTIAGADYTAINWEVYPQGLTDLLVRVHRDYGPLEIHITENGAAYTDQIDGNGVIADTERQYYVEAHIQAIAAAMHQGVPVCGYFAWSLFDNFEWAEGYAKRFGLIYIDYTNQERILKQSGHWYSRFVTQQRASHATIERR